MANNKPNVVVMKPGKGDVVSVRAIPQTKEDRQEDVKEFREFKNEQEEIKKERFAKIEERRKKRPSNGPRGDNGINITSES